MLGIAAGFYTLFILILFFPFFFQGKTIFSTDLYLMFYKPFAGKFGSFNPFNHFDVDILRFCYLYQWGAKEYLYQPYWIPEVFGGIPLYASTYASHFSPLNWILKLGPLHITYPLKLFTSLWIAGTSMFALITYFRISLFPALLSGLCYMFSGLFITMLLRWWIPGSFAWVPLILLFSWLGFYEGKKWATLFCSLFLAFSFLDGFMQSSAAILFTLGFYLLFLGWHKKKAKGVLHAILFGVVVFLIAFGLSAVMWLPQLEYFWLDMAKGSTRVAVNNFGKSIIERVLSIFFLVSGYFPQILGNVRTLDVSKLAKTHLQDFALFIGTIPLIFGIHTWKIRNSSVYSKSLWILVFLGLLIPIATPLDRFFYFRFLAVYILGMSALAAIGFNGVLLRSHQDWMKSLLKFFTLIWTALLVAGLAVRAILWIFPGKIEGFAKQYMERHFEESIIGARQPQWMIDRAEKFIHQFAFGSWSYVIPFIITGVSLILICFWYKKKIKKNVFIFSVFAITLLQLGIFAHSWLPFNSLEKYPLFPENELSSFLKKQDPKHEYRSLVNYINGTKKFENMLIPSNSNFFYGYYTIDGFEGVRPAAVSDILGDLDQYKRLGLLNVKYILTNPEPPLIAPHLKLRYKNSVAIYENQLAQPRARIFYSYEVADPKQIFKELISKGPREKTVLLEEPPVHLQSSSKQPRGDTQLLRDDRNTISYLVNMREPGIFVSSETYYPGWRAYWNDKEVKISRANYILRSVELPKGEGTLLFKFEPDIYHTGLKITSFTSLFLILSLIIFLWPLRKDFFRKGA